jgi:hypothetical protein
MNSEYKNKYLKYKLKYMALKKLLGGAGKKRTAASEEEPEESLSPKRGRRSRPKFELATQGGNALNVYIDNDYVDNLIIKYNRILQVIIPSTIKKTGYTLVGPTTLLTNPQCLQLAEGMTCNNINYGDDESKYNVKGTSEQFGQYDRTHDKIIGNIELSKKHAVDKRAAPEEGEAYAIVRQKVEKDRVPFHVAHVLMKDGDNTLTMEADAGNSKQKHPIFDMYIINNDIKSFHDRYKEKYTTASNKEPKTIVLTPIDPKILAPVTSS